MKNILSHPSWTGIGVIATIILGALTMFFSIDNDDNDGNVNQDQVEENQDPIEENIEKKTSEKIKTERETLKSAIEFKNELSSILLNLDKTEYQGTDFNYWPNGGMRNIYDNVKSIMDYSTLNDILPYNLFISGPHTDKSLLLNEPYDFGHYNPNAIKWIKIQVNEFLSNNTNTYSTKPFIDKYLKNQIFTYWISYQYLNKYKLEKARLLSDYRSKIENKTLPNQYYYDLAWKKGGDYTFIAEITNKHKFINSNLLYPAIYFWLRRDIDHTDDEFFNLLDTVIKKYYPADSFNLRLR